MPTPRTCDCVKPNGHFCGSLALRGRDYCYFHLTCVGRKLRAEKQHMMAAEPGFDLPPLEDINSIQVALMQVMDALVHHRIGTKVSGQLLYALQMATTNIKLGVDFQTQCQKPVDPEAAPKPEPVVMCDSYPSFEADYEVSDLSAELQANDGEATAAEVLAGPEGNQELAGSSGGGEAEGKLTSSGDAAATTATEDRAGPPSKAAGPQKVLVGLPKPPPQVEENWWRMRETYFRAEWARLQANTAEKRGYPGA
jgi:hypothetical protein